MDLPARTLAVCILDAEGTAAFHDMIAASPAASTPVARPPRGLM